MTSSIIQVKRSNVTPAVPPTTAAFGEFMFTSTTDATPVNTLYIGNSAGNAVDLGAFIGGGSGFTTAGNGLVATSASVVSAQPLATGTKNQVPLTVAAGGLSMPVDGTSIVANGSGQLSVGTISGGTF